MCVIWCFFTTQPNIHAHLKHIIIDVLITLRECRRRKYLVNVSHSTLVTFWTWTCTWNLDSLSSKNWHELEALTCSLYILWLYNFKRYQNSTKDSWTMDEGPSKSNWYQCAICYHHILLHWPPSSTMIFILH